MKTSTTDDADGAEHEHDDPSLSRSTLTSTKGKIIQRIRRLLNDSKYRNAERATIVENPKLVHDLYRNPKTRPFIRQILVDADRYHYHHSHAVSMSQHQQPQPRTDTLNNQEWSFLFDISPATMTQNKTIEIIRATPSVLKVCTDTIAHQGMLAVCDMPVLPSPASSSSSSSSFSSHQLQPNRRPYTFNIKNSSFRLILDGVSDPGNLGTIIRSAAATQQVDEIILLPGSCDPWNPKAIRAAIATQFLIPNIHSFRSHKEWYDHMQKERVQLYAATMLHHPSRAAASAPNKNAYQDVDTATSTRKSLSHCEIDWTDITPTTTDSGTHDTAAQALILGNEGSGLSDFVAHLVLDGSIQAVHVPMRNSDVESLNVAVSGSVILFERARQMETRKLAKPRDDQ